MKFLKKTDIKVDLNQAIKDMNTVLCNCNFDWINGITPGNSVGLNYRKGAENPWTDNFGSLYDKKQNKFIAKETDFSEWVPDMPTYTQGIIEDLAKKENFKIGRIRYLKLEKRSGISVHFDMEIRYHLVLKTNKHAFMGETVQGEKHVAECFHMPADGYFYRADTTREHFVYNGGWEDRIHLVIAAI